MKISWRFLIFGIFAFIALALWARADILQKQGFWKEKPDVVPTAACQIYNGGQLFWESTAEIGYATHQIAPIDTLPLQSGLDSLATYLKEHNDKMLKIIGSFQQIEKATKVAQFSTLGLGRAYWISERMTNLHISRSRYILQDSLISNNMVNFIELRIIDQP